MKSLLGLVVLFVGGVVDCPKSCRERRLESEVDVVKLAFLQGAVQLQRQSFLLFIQLPRLPRAEKKRVIIIIILVS